MDNKISSNKKVSRNAVYGRVYLKKASGETDPDSTYKKLRNDTSYGRRKKAYGSKGKSKVE
jgi:hypothetical protein